MVTPNCNNSVDTLSVYCILYVHNKIGRIAIFYLAYVSDIPDGYGQREVRIQELELRWNRIFSLLTSTYGTDTY